MAKEPSDKSRYPSKYSPKGWVTANQYIVELICEHKAVSQQQSLPVKFWELKHWGGFYRQQVKPASELLKTFAASAIIAALEDPRSKTTYSLRNPRLAKLIEEKQREYQAKLRREAEAERVEVAEMTEQPRIPFSTGKSLRSKLE